MYSVSKPVSSLLSIHTVLHLLNNTSCCLLWNSQELQLLECCDRLTFMTHRLHSVQQCTATFPNRTRCRWLLFAVWRTRTSSTYEETVLPLYHSSVTSMQSDMIPEDTVNTVILHVCGKE